MVGSRGRQSRRGEAKWNEINFKGRGLLKEKGVKWFGSCHGKQGTYPSCLWLCGMGRVWGAGNAKLLSGSSSGSNKF